MRVCCLFRQYIGLSKCYRAKSLLCCSFREFRDPALSLDFIDPLTVTVIRSLGALFSCIFLGKSWRNYYIMRDAMKGLLGEIWYFKYVDSYFVKPYRVLDLSETRRATSKQ